MTNATREALRDIADILHRAGWDSERSDSENEAAAGGGVRSEADGPGARPSPAGLGRAPGPSASLLTPPPAAASFSESDLSLSQPALCRISAMSRKASRVAFVMVSAPPEGPDSCDASQRPLR